MQTSLPPTAITLAEGNRPDEGFWNDLLAYIQEGSVVPIIGQDLMVVNGATGPTTLYRGLAERVAAKLGVPWVESAGGERTLGQVLSAWPELGQRRQSVYRIVREVLQELQVDVPQPLKLLARIRDLRLFVSTTFDGMLEQAMNEERGGGTRVVAFWPEGPSQQRDLPEDYLPGEETCVFHLFGRVSASPDYAVTEGDMLEFMACLQSESQRPNRLFDELQRRHLLVLGNSFPDWLERFFLRTAHVVPLVRPRNRQEVLIDKEVCANDALARFVSKFSSDTIVFRDGGAVEFVEELHRRWSERSGGQETAGAGEPASGAKQVFVSYSSKDRVAVAEVVRRMEAAGLSVWWDTPDLPPGADLQGRIYRGIDRCWAFVPVISRATEARQESWFREEWARGIERSRRFTGGKLDFLFPLVLDPTLDPDTAQAVPVEFRRPRWAPAPGGHAPEDFLASLVAVVRLRKTLERSPT